MYSLSLITLLLVAYVINVEGQEQTVQNRNRIHQRLDPRVYKLSVITKNCIDKFKS